MTKLSKKIDLNLFLINWMRFSDKIYGKKSYLWQNIHLNGYILLGILSTFLWHILNGSNDDK